MQNEIILQYIEGVCSKEITVVECDVEKSNQHEFNVTKDMKGLLGNSKKYFTNSYWLYIGESEQVKAKDTLSWYDAREKNPNRTEWRLYYGGNKVIERAQVGDWLFILKISEDYLALLVVEQKNEILTAVRHLLGDTTKEYTGDTNNFNKIKELIIDIVQRTKEREIEDEEEVALDNADSYDIVENVLVRNNTLQISFNSLINGIEQGDYIIPGFQRFYRWTEKQVENLAISFMRGMPIPPIYCYRNNEHQLVILDGQQRVLSLYLYYRGQYFKRKRNASADLRNVGSRGNSIPEMLESYEMKEKKYCMKIRDTNGRVKNVDITYKNLSKEAKRQLDYFVLTIINIDIDKEQYRDSMLHKIFANLNTGGTPLSDQELRNGIYYNKFYVMLFNFNRDNEKWRMLYGGSVNSRESKKSKDVEILLRMCAFLYYTKNNDKEIIVENYKDNMSVFLDDFSKITNNFSDRQISKFKSLLEQFCESIEETSGNNKYSGLVSFFVAWNLLKSKCKISSNCFKTITENEEYKNTILSHASGKTNIEKRFKYVYEELSKVN